MIEKTVQSEIEVIVFKLAQIPLVGQRRMRRELFVVVLLVCCVGTENWILHFLLKGSCANGITISFVRSKIGGCVL